MTEQLTWYFPRPELARKYLDQFEVGTGEPLTLFSKRQTGKTTFLLNEMFPAAEARGWLPVYIDLWSVRSNPTTAIVGELKSAYEDYTTPDSELGKRAKTKITSLNIMSFGVGFGDQPRMTEPDDASLKIGYWLRQVAAVAPKQVLLMIDEVQSLAAHPDGVNVISALRSALIRARGKVYTVFTGSSQSALATMFAHSRAPLYDFASHRDLPGFSRDFVEHIAQVFASRTHLQLDVAALAVAFAQLESMPSYLITMVMDMMAAKSIDVSAYLATHRIHMETRQNFRAQWDDCKAMEQAVLYRLSHDRELFSREGVKDYREALGVHTISDRSVRHALNNLIRKDVIKRGLGPDEYIFTNSAFAAWIRDNI